MKILKNNSLNKTSLLLKGLVLLFFTTFLLSSCSKDEEPIISSGVYQPPPPPPTVITLCSGRPLLSAKLEFIGSLSEARSRMLCATVGNKILFVDGYKQGGTWWYDPSIIDIYDFVTNKWSTASIFGGFRDGAAIASVGNKILFAGGGDGIGDNQTSRVDIYDASANSWTVQSLSIARQGIEAATLGNKVFFAGGGSAVSANLDVVDIYNSATNTWTTDRLSEGRINISATVIGDKIYFAGGSIGMIISKTIDIYDANTNSWSTSKLSEPRLDMASIGINNKIYWAGGINSFDNVGATFSNNVEILDVNTGSVSFECILPRGGFTAVKKGDNIIFFIGSYSNNQFSGDHFEIYNTITNSWSTGVLDQKISSSSIISANNTIYVAGGLSSNGQYNSQVWELKF